MRTVAQSFGKYSHERAITREEDAEVPIMELTVVDDIEPREGFPEPGTPVMKQIRFRLVARAPSTAANTASVVWVRSSMPLWQRVISLTFWPA